jgi:hypothetical protein
MTGIALGVAALATALATVVGLMLVVSYNRFVRQRNLVAESWRQIDVELVRRRHLVPDLVRAVQAHAAHERGVLEAVTAARSRAEARRPRWASRRPAKPTSPTGCAAWWRWARTTRRCGPTGTSTRGSSSWWRQRTA